MHSCTLEKLEHLTLQDTFVAVGSNQIPKHQAEHLVLVSLLHVLPFRLSRHWLSVKCTSRKNNEHEVDDQN